MNDATLVGAVPLHKRKRHRLRARDVQLTCLLLTVSVLSNSCADQPSIGLAPNPSEDSSEPRSLARRIEYEERLRLGSVLFQLTILDSANLDGMTWLTYPASVAMQHEVNDVIWIRYAWSGQDSWRVEIMDEERNAIRTILCDGENVDTGDAIWDGEFNEAYSRGALGQTYRGLLWPYYIVSARHLFPLTLGRDWSAQEWYSLHTIESASEAKSDEDSFVHLSVRDRSPLLVAREGADSETKDWVEASNAELSAMPIGIDVLSLDLNHGLAPVRWEQTYDGRTVEIYEWYDPVEIADGVWVHKTCTKSVPKSSTTSTVWRCEILLAESEFGRITFDNPFTIHGVRAKTRVRWPEE